MKLQNLFASCALALTLVPAAAQEAPLLTTAVHVPSAAKVWDRREKATNPTIVRSRFVRVDVAALRRIPLSHARTLASFSVDLLGRSITVDVHRMQTTLGYREFEGTVRGRTGHVHLAMAPDGVCAGTFHLVDANYALACAASANIHVVQELDESKLPKCACLYAKPGKLRPNSGSPEGGSDTILDVMVAYTPRARSTAGGKSAIETRIVNAIGQANTTNKNSNLPVNFRVVHMVETSYTENPLKDLSRFRGTTDGYMDEVHKLRDTYGADLMHLVTQPTFVYYCGVAYLMRSNTAGFNTSSFAVTLLQCLANNVVAHEIGHNIGCHHTRKNGTKAVYPYAYAFRTSDNRYSTTVAGPPGRVMLWSSPNVKYKNYVMGKANSEDNVHTIINTKGTVEKFRSTKLIVWCELKGGIAGQNGIPTITGDGTINKVRPITITIDKYRANANGLIVVGASTVNVPFLGGLLVPSPDILLGITGNGAPIKIDASALTTLRKGTGVWFQAMFRDAAATQGVAASNGFKVVVP